MSGDGMRRVSTGNAGADSILGGGFIANSVNIIMGAPGTGKTLFAQQLAMHNADAERPVLYLTTLSEPLAKVVTYLQQLGFYDERKIGTAVRYEDLGEALAEHGISAMVSRLRQAIKQLSPGGGRLASVPPSRWLRQMRGWSGRGDRSCRATVWRSPATDAGASEGPLWGRSAQDGLAWAGRSCLGWNDGGKRCSSG
jgi:hypothetical protein